MAFLDLSHPYAILGFSVAFYFILRTSLSLLGNIRYARSTGLNYIIYPFGKNFAELIIAAGCGLRLVQHLPKEWADYWYNTSYASHWAVQGRMARKYGGVYLAVSPAGVLCYVSDATAIAGILASREMFPKAVKSYKGLMVYGPNIVSVEGHEWLHHRKFTVSAFSERNNKLVWAESLNQAFDMLETWESISTTSNGVKAYRPDLQLNFTSIALHVMSMAGFGVPMKFTSEKPKNLDDIELFADGSTPPKGFTFSFRDALTFITTNFMQHTLVFFMLPSWFPKTWFSSIKRHHSAHADFGRYMKTIVSSSGEASIKQLGRSENNLRDLLIAGGKLYSENPNDGAKGLTSPELMGNLFVFIIAGQETTASLLYYAMLMLAIYPKKQQWVYENVAKTLEGESRDFREWKYEEVFPKLVSPLCLMLETLRLFAMVPYIPKTTCPEGIATLNYEGRSINIRATQVIIDITGAQRDSRYYGPDADQFDPIRWDASNQDSFLAKNKGRNGLMGVGLEYPTIHKPERGAFIGFSDGARGCLGRKFGQVEFVSIVSVILRDYRVELDVLDGETKDMAVARAWEAIERSRATIALRVREKIPLVLYRR